MSLFWIGCFVFAAGVVTGDLASTFINRRLYVMPAIDDLNTAIDNLATRVQGLQTASDPTAAVTAAVAANQATNDAAIEAATARINAIDATPAPPAEAAT